VSALHEIVSIVKIGEGIAAVLQPFPLGLQLRDLLPQPLDCLPIILQELIAHAAQIRVLDQEAVHLLLELIAVAEDTVGRTSQEMFAGGAAQGRALGEMEFQISARSADLTGKGHSGGSVVGLALRSSRTSPLSIRPTPWLDTLGQGWSLVRLQATQRAGQSRQKM